MKGVSINLVQWREYQIQLPVVKNDNVSILLALLKIPGIVNLYNFTSRDIDVCYVLPKQLYMAN